ncbi:MAG: long-chain fatty acid--CoA ligase [Actinomycetes bacterium]
MLSTMQDYPLTVGMVFRHGRAVHPDGEVVTFDGEGTRTATFTEVADRAERLAAALGRLGIGAGDRVATLCWNHQEHVEAYFAIPGMGAVLHTLNLRLFPEQLEYIVNHAEDRAIVVDASLLPIITPLVSTFRTVEHYIVIGPAEPDALDALRTGAQGAGAGADVLDYETLLAAEAPGFDWPEVDERSAAAMCYTSGTTGNPKGVVYSHRSTVLHSMAACFAQTNAISERERILLIVPMFHANAWGLPYAGWLVGADLHMPARFLQAEPLSRFIEAARPTYSAAVPTIWADMLRHARTNPVDLSSIRTIICGGSAVPRQLIEAFDAEFGITMLQAWGMTETSPLAAVARPPRGIEPGTTEEMDWRAHTGRVVPGVELRIVDDAGTVLPWDGESVGEIQVRGPWITGAYYLDDSDEKFDDGWLRTGDVAHVDRLGFVQITDRSKDVIKSGGEWISSVELENAIMAHPEVREAAVVAVPDPRWDERPLACVVLEDGAAVDAASLREFLGGSVAKWQLPERWAFIAEVPKTSVGKFDKKVLRARYADGALDVVTL